MLSLHQSSSVSYRMQCCFWCIWTCLNGYHNRKKKSILFALFDDAFNPFHGPHVFHIQVGHAQYSQCFRMTSFLSFGIIKRPRHRHDANKKTQMKQSWIYQTQRILDSDVGSHMLMLRRLGATADVGWLLFKCIALQWFAGMKPSGLKWMKASATTRYAHWTVSSKS